MHFEAKKVIVIGGGAGMGRQVAIDVIDHSSKALVYQAMSAGHKLTTVDASGCGRRGEF
jgi:hypothetical protein